MSKEQRDETWMEKWEREQWARKQELPNTQGDWRLTLANWPSPRPFNR